jgi:hypothetical protein
MKYIILFCYMLFTTHLIMTSETTKCITIHNSLSDPVGLVYYNYSNNSKLIHQRKHRIANNTYTYMDLETHPETIIEKTILFIPEACPPNIHLQINQPNKPIQSGSCLYIRETEKGKGQQKLIEIGRESGEKTIPLIFLHKSNNSIRIGTKQIEPPIYKTFTIRNINLFAITVTNEAYQKPIESNLLYNPTKENKKLLKLLHSNAATIRKEEQTPIITYTAFADKRIIDNAIIIKILGALQKFKIRPSNDIIQSNDILSIQFFEQTGAIELFNKQGTCLAQTSTLNSYREI